LKEYKVFAKQFFSIQKKEKKKVHYWSQIFKQKLNETQTQFTYLNFKNSLGKLNYTIHNNGFIYIGLAY